ncbi:MAG TPA: lamin tail domain-containing protein [Kofleriaceae bacterium]|jgi:hypothetical protein
MSRRHHLVAACLVVACSGARSGDDLDAAVPESPADAAPPIPGRLTINEIAAAGEPADWFEVTNVGSEAIDLAGYTFTDDPAIPDQALFPDGTTVAPGELRVFWVDDDEAGFALGSDEELAVFGPDGQVADSVDWDEGESPDGGSFARVPDGQGAFITLEVATPGEPNAP